MSKSVESKGEILIARNERNVVNTVTVPVIFLPGAMGSRLKFGVGEDMVRWDPDSGGGMVWNWAMTTMKTEYLQFLKTPVEVDKQVETYEERMAKIEMMQQHDGIGPIFFIPEITNAERERGWGGVMWGSYGVLAMHLRNLRVPGFRCPVHAIGYNWCQSNEQSAKDVAVAINEILGPEGAKKCILVTHSMGGLVARAACKLSELESKVVGIIHVAQPVYGAAVAYRRFHTGACRPKTDRNSTDLIEHIKDRVLTKIIGNEWWKFTTNMSALPGPLQLLPNDHYTMYTRDTPRSLAGTRIAPPISMRSPFSTPKEPASHWLRRSHPEGPYYTTPGTPRNQLAAESFSDATQGESSIFDAYRSDPTLKIIRDCSDDTFGLMDDWSGYVEDNWPTMMSDLAGHLTTAKSFHEKLGTYQHPTTSVAVGNEFSETEAGCVIGTGMSIDDDHEWHSEPGNSSPDTLWGRPFKDVYVRVIEEPGDKTVPFESAMALEPSDEGEHVKNPERQDPPRRLIATGEHQDIFKTPEVLEFVEQNIHVLLARAM